MHNIPNQKLEATGRIQPQNAELTKDLETVQM